MNTQSNTIASQDRILSQIREVLLKVYRVSSLLTEEQREKEVDEIINKLKSNQR